jgi:hypothetical protein
MGDVMGDHPALIEFHLTQCGAPQLTPLTIDIGTINHSYWSYKPTERYLGGSMENMMQMEQEWVICWDFTKQNGDSNAVLVEILPNMVCEQETWWFKQKLTQVRWEFGLAQNLNFDHGCFSFGES